MFFILFFKCRFGWCQIQYDAWEYHYKHESEPVAKISVYFTMRNGWLSARVFIMHNSKLLFWKYFTYHSTSKFSAVISLTYQDLGHHLFPIPMSPPVSYTSAMQQSCLSATCPGFGRQPAHSVSQSVSPSASQVPLHGWMWTGRGQTPWWEGPVGNRWTLTWVPFMASHYCHKSIKCLVSAGWQHQHDSISHQDTSKPGLQCKISRT